MILTDDNFATIIKAVEKGRALYDNLLKYIRFQLAQLIGFILTYLGAALFNIAGGIPFTPAQVLWINFLVDSPPGMLLGRDKATAGLMAQKPRPANESIVTRPLAVARTVGFVTFSLTHLYAALSYRHPAASVFRRETFDNRALNLALLFSLLMILLPTEVGFLSRGMNLVSLSFEGWLLCAGVASLTLWVSEGYKWVAYRRN